MTTREDGFIDAGELRTYVELLHPPVPDDFRGNTLRESAGRCWAAWRPIAGKRSETLQQQYGSVTASVVIRYRPGIRSGMYVKRLGDGKEASIAGVVAVDNGERWLELMVNEVTG